MARIRSLKPEFWTDEELACQLTRDERFLYLGLWNLADEHSRLRGDPRYIKGQLFPYDDDITATVPREDARQPRRPGESATVQGRARPVLFLPNLSRHQRLETEKVVPAAQPRPRRVRRKLARARRR